ALQLIALPHLDQIVDAVDADQRLYLAADCGVGVPRISALEGRASSERGERGEVRAGGCAEQADALRIDSERASAAADELHGRKHVVDRLGKHFLSLLRQAIADGE